jgi:hypothetical protein
MGEPDRGGNPAYAEYVDEQAGREAFEESLEPRGGGYGQEPHEPTPGEPAWVTEEQQAELDAEQAETDYDNDFDWDAVDEHLDTIEGVYGPEAQQAEADHLQAFLEGLADRYPELQGEAGGRLVREVRTKAAQHEWESGEQGLAVSLERDPVFIETVWSGLREAREEEANTPKTGDQLFLALHAESRKNVIPWGAS